LLGCLFSILQIFYGDRQGKMVTDLQPPTLAAMEGLFQARSRRRWLSLAAGRAAWEDDNPIEVPGMLSMLTYRRWSAHVRGLDAFCERRLAGQHSASLLQLPTSWWG